MSRKQTSNVNVKASQASAKGSKASSKGNASQAPADATVTPQQVSPNVVMVPVAVRTPQLPKRVAENIKGLTAREVRAMQIIAAAGAPVTRKHLQAQTGQAKGWSRLLGASTKGASIDTLAGRGLVNVSATVPFEYTLTEAGAEALAAATKPLPVNVPQVAPQAATATPAPVAEPKPTKAKASKAKAK